MFLILTLKVGTHDDGTSPYVRLVASCELAASPCD